MNSKLTILADGKPLALKEDASISIELKNPLFNDNEMFSYPVELPIEGNRHFLKNAAPDIPDALFKKFHSNLLRKRIKEKGLHKAALKPYLHIRNIQRRNRFVNKG